MSCQKIISEYAYATITYPGTIANQNCGTLVPSEQMDGWMNLAGNTRPGRAFDSRHIMRAT